MEMTEKTLELKETRFIILPDRITVFNEQTGHDGDLKDMLELYESKIIAEAYSRLGTSIAVAKELNISQASASRKIRKYLNI